MFKNTVFKLIDEKREGTYWDFKKEYHCNKARLLHDIICLANNIDNREAYLIFGVADDGKIVGVEDDENRKNQEHFTSFLRGKNFAGNVAPYVVLQTINITGQEIDVLIIKKSDKVPFYLEERFRDGKIVISSGSIYLRIEDRNTPINLTADPLHTELLWKIRFGLLPIPIERLKSLLLQKSKWKTNQDGYYFEDAPEFTIVENKEQSDSYDNRSAPFYAYHQTNPTMFFHFYECKYHNTVLFESQTASLDSGRYHTPVPEFGFINVDSYGNETLEYRYFIKGTLLYNMNIFMYDEGFDEARYARRRLLEIIPIFESELERRNLEEFIKGQMSTFLSELDYQSEEDLVFDIVDENKRVKTIFNQRIHTGLLLVKKLYDYRTMRG